MGGRLRDGMQGRAVQLPGSQEMISRYGSMAVFLLLVIAAAAFGSSFEAGEWYYALRKPDWTPPPWVFGPVWSILYLLMALAMWKVWLSGRYVRIGALIWWLLQLGLTAAWSWLFFGLHRPGWSMLEMALLIGVVLLCVKAFAAISRVAAWLMAPYLLWLLFAWALNYAIWSMNGGGLASYFG
jgi:tryptophan-rich sensory protein